MITVYTKCPTCGIEGVKVREVLKYSKVATVLKSGVHDTPERNEEQLKLQAEFGIPTLQHVSIVVEKKNGKVVSVVPLKDWQAPKKKDD